MLTGEPKLARKEAGDKAFKQSRQCIRGTEPSIGPAHRVQQRSSVTLDVMGIH